MHKTGVTVAALVCVVSVSAALYTWYFSDRILPRTWIGSIAVGSLTRDAAAVRLQEALDALDANGIVLSVEGATQTIIPDNIGLDLNLSEAIDGAYHFGHEGSVPAQTWKRVSALWSQRRTDAPVHFDDGALRTQITRVGDSLMTQRRDVRLAVNDASVS